VCGDGQNPAPVLIVDGAGNLYGTTIFGGPATQCPSTGGCGVLFKLSPGGNETVLHAFCSEKNCADGALPMGGLIRERDGTIFGTATFGGVTSDKWCYPDSGVGGCGTFFKLAPDGTETVLHTFLGQLDGENPVGSIVEDKAGNIYGMTFAGLSTATFYRMARNGTKSTLLTFNSQPSPVVLDEQGNLYATIFNGGRYSEGFIFKLAPDGTRTILHEFAPNGGNVVRFPSPDAPLTWWNHTLYGTTMYGGRYSPPHCQYYGCGSVFEIQP
jgi:uncharacterized repeat protein (TIGR03803 family)